MTTYPQVSDGDVATADWANTHTHNDYKLVSGTVATFTPTSGSINVFILAKGNTSDSSTGSGNVGGAINLVVDGSTVDTVNFEYYSSSSEGAYSKNFPFCLTYCGTFSTTAHTVQVTTNLSSLQNVKITIVELGVATLT